MTEYQTIERDETVAGRSGAIKLHGPEGFAGMRAAGRLAAEILDALVPHVVPGVTTQALDDIVARMTLDGGAIPATLGYRGYTQQLLHLDQPCRLPRHSRRADAARTATSSISTSPPILDGWHGDTSRMYLVGDVPMKARRLVDVTYECLMLGIEQARPGNHLGDIGHAIQTHAEEHRYGVVRDFCGHGLGQLFHDAPEVSMPAVPAPAPSCGPACSSRSSR